MYFSVDKKREKQSYSLAPLPGNFTQNDEYFQEIYEKRQKLPLLKELKM